MNPPSHKQQRSWKSQWPNCCVGHSWIEILAEPARVQLERPPKDGHFRYAEAVVLYESRQLDFDACFIDRERNDRFVARAPAVFCNM